MLSIIPPHVLNHIAVIKNDIRFAQKMCTKVAPQRILKGIGEELARTEGEEPLRSALVSMRLYLDKEGLCAMNDMLEEHSLG